MLSAETIKATTTAGQMPAATTAARLQSTLSDFQSLLDTAAQNDNSQGAGTATLEAPADPKKVAAFASEYAAFKTAAESFEGMMIGQLLNQNNHGAEGTVMDGGMGESIFRSELNQEWAKKAGKSGGFGIAAMMEKKYSPTIRAQLREKYGLSKGQEPSMTQINAVQMKKGRMAHETLG